MVDGVSIIIIWFGDGERERETAVKMVLFPTKQIKRKFN